MFRCVLMILKNHEKCIERLLLSRRYYTLEPIHISEMQYLKEISFLFLSNFQNCLVYFCDLYAPSDVLFQG